jgi:hypothetical protein
VHFLKRLIFFVKRFAILSPNLETL